MDTIRQMLIDALEDVAYAIDHGDSDAVHRRIGLLLCELNEDKGIEHETNG